MNDCKLADRTVFWWGWSNKKKVGLIAENPFWGNISIRWNSWVNFSILVIFSHYITDILGRKKEYYKTNGYLTLKFPAVSLRSKKASYLYSPSAVYIFLYIQIFPCLVFLTFGLRRLGVAPASLMLPPCRRRPSISRLPFFLYSAQLLMLFLRLSAVIFPSVKIF